MEERPREKVLRNGPEHSESADLLAILLRTGTKGRNVLEIAREMLRSHGSLEALSRASIEELRSIKGIGRDKAITLKAAFVLARRIAEEIRAEKPLVDTPERVAELLRDESVNFEVEQFQVLLLNTRRRLIQRVLLSQGTLDTLLVHPRDVFRPAIAASAAAIILVHNHPSGDPSPSEADIKVTRDLIRAGKLLKIEVLDHVILGSKTEARPSGYASLRELGYFYS